MKKILSLALALLLLCLVTACSNNQNSEDIAPPTEQNAETLDNPAESNTPSEDTTDNSSALVTESPAVEPAQTENEVGHTVNVKVGDSSFTAILYDNESARTIIEQMPFSLDMGDYAGQEKVTGLPFDLPDAPAEKPDIINVGDIYLWSGNSLVLFYTPFSNSYSYVPVGYIEDTAGLTEALGGGRVQVFFSVD